MPHLDGNKVIMTIRKVQGAKNVPIIVFSGQNDDMSVERTKQFGIEAFLEKPSSSTEILETVNKLLRKTKSLLVPNGLGLICVSKSSVSEEGLYVKKDLKGEVKRFKKFWTERELIETLKEYGFNILEVYYNHDKVVNRDWLDVIYQKS